MAILLLPNMLALADKTAEQAPLMPGTALLPMTAMLQMMANTPPLPLTLQAMPG